MGRVEWIRSSGVCVWRGMAAKESTPARRPGNYSEGVAWQVPHTELFPRAKAADALTYVHQGFSVWRTAARFRSLKLAIIHMAEYCNYYAYATPDI